MSDDSDLEDRLNAILAKVDALLALSPPKKAPPPTAPSPTERKVPELIQAPEIARFILSAPQEPLYIPELPVEEKRSPFEPLILQQASEEMMPPEPVPPDPEPSAPAPPVKKEHLLLSQPPKPKLLKRGPPRPPKKATPEPAVILLPAPIAEPSPKPAPKAEVKSEPALVLPLVEKEKSKEKEGEIPFLIGYPEPMKEVAQRLWDKLEVLQPKFTKMTFSLRGRACIPYTPGQSQLETSFSQARDMQGGVLLLLTSHRLVKKVSEPLSAEFSRCGFHFQEVLIESVDSKAFYYDFLLGLVFFMKSRMKLSEKGEWSW